MTPNMGNSVQELDAKDHARVHVGDIYYQSEDKCLADLRSTDPRDDKSRIERTKGGLLKDAYRWILDNADFHKWRDAKENRLLWIKGDPGKGKTMLLIGIIGELEQQRNKLRQQADESQQSQQQQVGQLSYFFCQGTDARLNNATAVLRGLIYLLIIQEPSLMSHIRDKYQHGGKELFEDVNAFDALRTIFIDILRDRKTDGACLVVDALDECERDRPQLLDLIVHAATTCRHVKWLISSRNNPDIESRLRLDSKMKLSLELNQEHVSQAVEIFVNHKVTQLESIKDDSTLQEHVRSQMLQKANGTFLWVALVFQELKDVDSWDVEQVLEEVPADLPPLYERMLKQVQQLKRREPEWCRLLLATVTVAYRPLNIHELAVLCGLPLQISSNATNIKTIIGKCGSFLAIQDNTVYFLHQSAQNFLLSQAFNTIYPSGKEEVHYTVFQRSLYIMSKTLRRDMDSLGAPGSTIDHIEQPDPDPLAASRYACIYWVDHLFDWNTNAGTSNKADIQDGGLVDVFMREKYLYWLEALSLCGSMPAGVVSMMKLDALLKVDFG